MHTVWQIIILIVCLNISGLVICLLEQHIIMRRCPAKSTPQEKYEWYLSHSCARWILPPWDVFKEFLPGYGQEER
jgi:hypothetical protein